MSDIVHVAVAVIMNESGEVCISLRHKDAHQGGLWEFPGGKMKAGESVEQALKREVKEELNVSIMSSRSYIDLNYSYPDVTVSLHVKKVLSYSGQVSGMEGQAIKWVSAEKLTNFTFPSANKPIITALQLPTRYMITGQFTDEDDFIYKLNKSIKNNISLIQLRLKNENLEKIINPNKFIYQVSDICEKGNVKLLLNLSEKWLKVINLDAINFSGIHADSRTLMEFDVRPKGKLFSASCHNLNELEKAQDLNADFVVVSPVKKTTSHPNVDAIGWEEFLTLVEKVSMPIYALGGLSRDDLPIAWDKGAQGIAAITAFWGD